MDSPIYGILTFILDLGVWSLLLNKIIEFVML